MIKTLTKERIEHLRRAAAHLFGNVATDAEIVELCDTALAHLKANESTPAHDGSSEHGEKQSQPLSPQQM